MKKKGSALVFSVLILSFFLAISLNIFFLARKKSERAGVKVAGERITNNIDIASSIGYQELLIAENFVRIGFPYNNTHPASINDYYNNNGTIASPGELHLDPSTGFYKVGRSFSGIQINNLIDYFSSEWDYTLDSDGDDTTTGTNSQKLIIGENLSGEVALSRIWQSIGMENKLIPLWSITDSSGISIGGYKLTSTPINTSTDSLNNQAIYEKTLLLEEVPGLIPEISFRITVTETFDYSAATGAYNRSLTSFVIEAIK